MSRDLLSVSLTQSLIDTNRNIQGYVKAVHTGSDVANQLDGANNQTVVLQSVFGSSNVSDIQVQSFRQACGYVEWTTVPDHAAGILFSVSFSPLDPSVESDSVMTPPYRHSSASSTCSSWSYYSYQSCPYHGHQSQTSSYDSSHLCLKMHQLVSLVPLCFGFLQAF